MAKKRFSPSLVQRVLSICFLLVIVPLIVYSAIVWDRDFRIKINTIFSELRLIGDSSLEIYDEWLALQQNQLENFVNDEGTSTMFIFNENFEVIFSSQEEMEGAKNIFPKELKEAAKNKVVVFAAMNPFIKREEIFVLKRFGNEIRGLSVPAELFASHFNQKGRVDLSLVDMEGTMLYSNYSDHSNDRMFTPGQIEVWNKHIPFFKAYSLRNSHLVLSLNLPHARFDFQIAISGEQIANLEGGKHFHRLIELVLIILVLGGVGTWWLVTKMAKPFHQLTHVMDAVEAQDYERRYQEDRFGFEINALGAKFNEMLERLLTNMEEAKNERVKKELLSKELQIGRAVQKELFPKEIPQFPGFKFGFQVIFAKEVGGDFYDLFVKDNEHLMFAIADASDKGLSACLYSLIVRSILRSSCLAEPSLRDAIIQANNLFYQDVHESSNFVTAWVGFYEVAHQRLTYTSAGHLPALLLHPDGQIEELTTSGIALGASLIKEVEVRSLQLPPRSLLLLYTDGLIETHNEKGELFGKSRLFDFLKIHNQLEPQLLVDQLVAEVGHFAEQAAQHDDLTILCLKNS